MSPSLRSRPGGHIRLLVLGLLLAVAALLVAPAADASGRLTVNVLGGEAAAQVRAAGATPRLVTRTSASLQRVQADLDTAGTAPAGASWGSTWPPTPCW